MKKIKGILGTLVLGIILTACNVVNAPSPEANAPIDNAKKLILSEDAKFGKLEYKKSSEWREEKVGDSIVYTLNDEKVSYLQLHDLTGGEEEDAKANPEQMLANYYNANSEDLNIEEVNGGKTATGYILTNTGLTLHVKTFLLVKNEDAYLVAVASPTQIEQVDIDVFNELVKSIK